MEHKKYYKKTKKPVKKNMKSFIKAEAGYWIGLVSGLVTIICAFLNSNLPLWIVILWLTLITVTIIVIAIRVAIFIKNSMVTKKEIINRGKNITHEKIKKCHEQYKICSEEVHKYFHNMRDVICSYSPETLQDDSFFEQVLRNVCSDIESIYKTLWPGYRSSVCLKRIIVEPNMEQDYEKWKVETIARSSGTKQSRNKHNHKAVSILENSDFYIIISPEYEDSVFACMDLTKVKESFWKKYKKEYRNSTEKYINIYKSTIVAPIRIQVDKMNPILRKDWMNGISFHLVGFLCIDTETIFRGSTSEFDIGIELAKATADILYKLIENRLIGT